MNEPTIYICEDLLNDTTIIKDRSNGETYAIPTPIMDQLAYIFKQLAIAEYRKEENRKLQLEYCQLQMARDIGLSLGLRI